jgi:hypothetical protein
MFAGCGGSQLRPRVARDFFFDADGRERTAPITSALFDMDYGDETRTKKAIAFLTDVFENSEGPAGGMAGKALFEFVVRHHPEYLTDRLEDLVATKILRLAKSSFPEWKTAIFEHWVTGVDLRKPPGSPPRRPNPFSFSIELKERLATHSVLQRDGVVYVSENSWPSDWRGKDGVVEFDGRVIGRADSHNSVVEIDLMKILKNCTVPSKHVITSKMTIITPSKREIRVSEEYRFSYVSAVRLFTD